MIKVLVQLADLAIQIYIFIIVGRALISWVNPDPYNPIVRFLHKATDPVFYRIRRVHPLVFGGMDLAPMVVLLFLFFLQEIILRLAHSLG